MDTQKKTENIGRESCPICGIRRRKSNCLVCLECNDPNNPDFGQIGRLREELETNNEDAILNGQLDDIVDVWGRIFDFVLEIGGQTVEKKQAELSQFIELRNTKFDELQAKAGKHVSKILGVLAKNKNAKFFAKGISRGSLVEKQLEKLKSQNGVKKIIDKVYALGKCISAINNQLAGIRKKREEHLAEVEENSSDNEVVAVV